MKKIIINDKEYKLLKDNRDAFDLEVVESLMTEYFDEFDYVVGDWSYGKLRLKGFYKSDNSKVKKSNDIANLDDYINDRCAYGCKWFEIMKND